MENSLYISPQLKDKINAFQELLLKWQKKINLISPTTINQIDQRHIQDSLQLIPYLPEKTPVWDLGSGAGFPGIILSIAGFETRLLESDLRKSIFLNEVCRTLNLSAKVSSQRVEQTRVEDFPENAIITARAFAPLPRLLNWTQHLLSKNPTYVLLKGEKTDEELKSAQEEYDFEYEKHPSQTDPRGTILILKKVKPRHG